MNSSERRVRKFENTAARSGTGAIGPASSRSDSPTIEADGAVGAPAGVPHHHFALEAAHA